MESEADELEAAERRVQAAEAREEAAAAAAAARSKDPVERAQGAHGTWHSRTGQAKREAHFEGTIRPALEALGVDWDAFKQALNAPMERAVVGVGPSARVAFDRMLLHLPERVRAYAATRVATFAKAYGKKYRAERAKHPVHLLAHNGASFDNCALLDHFCATGRLSVERAAFTQEVEMHGHAASEEVTAALQQLSLGETRTVDTGGSRFIDVKYKNFVFRDSYKQLAKSLDVLGASFNVPTLKSTFPHAYLKSPAIRYADEDRVFKPPRRYFEVNVKTVLKHNRRGLLKPEEYAKVPGKEAGWMEPAGSYGEIHDNTCTRMY